MSSAVPTIVLLPGLACDEAVWCCGLRRRRSAVTPLEYSQNIASGIAHGRLEVVAGAGHLLTWEQPERVSALLLQWLAGLPAFAPAGHAG